MIITIVFDQFSEANNGTTMTARRFAEALAKRGNEVRILGGAASGSPILKYYETGTVKLFRPVRGIFVKQGMVVSKINKEIIKKACDGADIVHFLIGFKFERYVKKYCDKHHIPTCSAFHCQPENITSTIYLGHSKVVNDMVYRIFRSFYDKFEDIHCPSKMIADQLKEHHYKGTTHIISNGVSSIFKKMDVEKPEQFKDKFVVLMIGRYSVEKRQDLIIKAIKESKYESKIQLILAGQGPWEKHLRELSKGLTNEPVFGFYNQDELLKVINYSDLYVHSSDADIEAISCIEAFSCGLVPVISDNKLVATGQFALCDESLFESGNPTSLKDKIEYWIEHEDKKKEYSLKYIEEGKKFSLDASVEAFDTLLKEIVERENKEFANKK